MSEVCPWDGCNYTSSSKTGIKIHHKRIHDVSLSFKTFECDECGEEYERRVHKNNRYDGSFCSQECRVENGWDQVECDECGEYYRTQKCTLAKNNDTEYNFCSRECFFNHQSSVKSVTKPCSNCGEKVTRNKFEFERYRNIYCSQECYSESISGKGSPRWKENTEKEGFTQSERKEIFERDNYTCQECGERGCHLNAHHIVPISEGGDVHDTSNGVTLCLKCHRDRHKERGDTSAAALIESRM